MKKIWIVGMMCLIILAGCVEKSPGEKAPEAASSNPLDSGLSRFKDAFHKNEYPEALAALRSSFEAFWEQTPLFVQNVKFVMSDSASYGIYAPRHNDEFVLGEPIYVYLEPVGQTLKKNAQGQYEFGFAADFSLEDETGKVLGGQTGFADPSFTSWNFNTEIALTFTFTFSGLEKGKYKLILTVRDAYSEKKSVTDKLFSII